MTSTRYGVIDIGSNSVRLLISEGGKCLKKQIITARLAENAKDGLLKDEPSFRALKAVSEFIVTAKNDGADKIFVFATAAVRNAINGKEFADEIEKSCGIPVDIVSGEIEGKLGVLGALHGADGAVLDIGGGSTEIAVMKGGKIIYSKSLPIGAVALTDKFGQDADKIYHYVIGVIKEYGEIPKADFYCIGGTCTSLAALAQKLAVYNRDKVDGYKFTIEEISRLTDKICALNVGERKLLVGLQKERADIIHAGAIIFKVVAEYVKADCFTVSESDNLEGYLQYVTEKL